MTRKLKKINNIFYIDGKKAYYCSNTFTGKRELCEKISCVYKDVNGIQKFKLCPFIEMKNIKIKL